MNNYNIYTKPEIKTVGLIQGILMLDISVSDSTDNTIKSQEDFLAPDREELYKQEGKPQTEANPENGLW